MKRHLGILTLVLGLSLPATQAREKPPGLALIPAGSFDMGDHHGFVDPKHGSDETPIHKVRLDPFFIGINDVTTREYCEFLNSALAQRMIEVRQGGVYLVGGKDLLCETREMSPHSRIGWGGGKFTVLDNLPTANGARTMELDPRSHTVFVVTADRKPGTPTAEQPKPRPVPVAGTFRLLVLGR